MTRRRQRERADAAELVGVAVALRVESTPSPSSSHRRARCPACRVHPVEVTDPSVSMRPGMIWLTRMPAGASSARASSPAPTIYARKILMKPGSGSALDRGGGGHQIAPPPRCTRALRADHPQGAEQQQVRGVLPGDRRTERQPAGGLPGIGHQRVDAAEAILRRLHLPPGRRRAVHGCRRTVAPVSPDARRGRGNGRLVP